jgi:hypothetical protein
MINCVFIAPLHWGYPRGTTYILYKLKVILGHKSGDLNCTNQNEAERLTNDDIISGDFNLTNERAP